MTDDPYKPPAHPSRPRKPAWSYAFRDATGRATTLKVLLWMSVAVAMVALVSDIMQIQLLNSLMEGQDVSAAEEDATDVRQGLIAGVDAILLLCTAVVFLTWVHRASSNARALATRRMEFTPGWSVGWYIVPIWCLWKPFQAMREIWQVSQEGSKYHVPSGLLTVWWVSWLAYSIVAGVAGRAHVSAANAPEASSLSRLQVATSLDLVSQVLYVGLCIVAVHRGGADGVQDLQDAVGQARTPQGCGRGGDGAGDGGDGGGGHGTGTGVAARRELSDPPMAGRTVAGRPGPPGTPPRRRIPWPPPRAGSCGPAWSGSSRA